MINILKRKFAKCGEINKYYNFFKTKFDEKTFERIEKIENKTMTLSLYMTKSFKDLKDENVFNNYYVNSLLELNNNLENKGIKKLSDFEILKDLVLEYKNEKNLNKIEKAIFEKGKKILEEKNYLLNKEEKDKIFDFIKFENFSKEKIEESLNLKKLIKKARGWTVEHNLEKKKITIKNENRKIKIILFGFSEKNNFDDFVDFQIEMKNQDYEIDNLILDHPIFYSEKNRDLDHKTNSQKFQNENYLRDEEEKNLDIDFNPDYKLNNEKLSSFLNEDVLNMNNFILNNGFFYINCLNKPLYFNFMSNLVGSFVQDGKRHLDTLLILSDLHLQEIMQLVFFRNDLEDFYKIWDLNRFVNIIEDIKYFKDSVNFGCFNCENVQKKLIPKYFAFDLYKDNFFFYKEEIISKQIFDALSQKKNYNLITVINQNNLLELTSKILKLINQQNIMGTTFYEYDRKNFLSEQLGDIPINTDMFSDENIEKKILLESLSGEKYKKKGDPNENPIFTRYRQAMKGFYCYGLDSLLEEKKREEFEIKNKDINCGAVNIVFSNLENLQREEVTEEKGGYSDFKEDKKVDNKENNKGNNKEKNGFKLPPLKKFKNKKLKFKMKNKKK